MTTFALYDLRLAAAYGTDEIVPDRLTVDLRTDTWLTILRVPLLRPVAAGDLLKVAAWFRTTNDIPNPYAVGVGAHFWQYDLDYYGPGQSGPPARLSPTGSVGMNVHRELHHLLLSWTFSYVVPAGWPPGHRIAIMLRADAHSTAWDRDGDGIAEDHLTVDPQGQLVVDHYTAA